MRFKASIHNISTFTKFTAALSSLGPVAWVRLNEREARFTIIPEQGTQLWAVLSNDIIFDPKEYVIQSAANNVINLEVPLQHLLRALQSARSATAASIRLTKRDNMPILSLTITASALPGSSHAFNMGVNSAHVGGPAMTGQLDEDLGADATTEDSDRETIITQEVPIRVLGPASVEGIHEPRCREPDVHIFLPPLAQLKAVSDRLTKLAAAESSGRSGGAYKAQRLEMSANMHGKLRLRFRTDAMAISSTWENLDNPELDPEHVEGGEEGVASHPSTRMRQVAGDEGWALVRIDGRDWGKVMSVGRLGGRVIACFCHEHALILYAYLPNEEEGRAESVLTYYVSSYSA